MFASLAAQLGRVLARTIFVGVLAEVRSSRSSLGTSTTRLGWMFPIARCRRLSAPARSRHCLRATRPAPPRPRGPPTSRRRLALARAVRSSHRVTRRRMCGRKTLARVPIQSARVLRTKRGSRRCIRASRNRGLRASTRPDRQPIRPGRTRDD
jgi:hypothetical protein